LLKGTGVYWRSKRRGDETVQPRWRAMGHIADQGFQEKKKGLDTTFMLLKNRRLPLEGSLQSAGGKWGEKEKEKHRRKERRKIKETH